MPELSLPLSQARKIEYRAAVVLITCTLRRIMTDDRRKLVRDSLRIRDQQTRDMCSQEAYVIS